MGPGAPVQAFGAATAFENLREGSVRRFAGPPVDEPAAAPMGPSVDDARDGLAFLITTGGPGLACRPSGGLGRASARDLCCKSCHAPRAPTRSKRRRRHPSEPSGPCRTPTGRPSLCDPAERERACHHTGQASHRFPVSVSPRQPDRCGGSGREPSSGQTRWPPGPSGSVPPLRCIFRDPVRAFSRPRGVHRSPSPDQVQGLPASSSAGSSPAYVVFQLKQVAWLIPACRRSPQPVCRLRPAEG